MYYPVLAALSTPAKSGMKSVLSSIRDATTEDVPTINHLYNCIIREGLLQDDFHQSIHETQTAFNELQTHGYPHVVSTVNEQIVGYASYGPYYKITAGNGSEFTVRPTWMVAKPWRRQGIGASLHQALKEHERTATKKLYCCLRMAWVSHAYMNS